MDAQHTTFVVIYMIAGLGFLGAIAYYWFISRDLSHLIAVPKPAPSQDTDENLTQSES